MNRKKRKLRHPIYNDGVLFYGKIEPVYNSAKKKIGENFKEIGHLFYQELSSRDSDNITANALGYVIDKKVKTPYCEKIKTFHKVKINDVFFDVVSLDNDKINSFIYLQRVGV